MVKNVRTYHYNNTTEGEVRSKWWCLDIPDEERHRHIWAVVRNIMEKQSYRSLNNTRFARLFLNQEIRGLDAGMYSRVVGQNNFLSNRVTLNVIKSCTDTVVAKIGKNRPRPLFLTEDGNWSLQRRARKLTQYMDGWLDQSKTYLKGRQSFTDACILGTGFVKVYRERTKVCTERIIPEEIIVDDVEGMYGCPRQMHQKKNVFREVLLDMYPEHRAKIVAAPSALKGEQVSESYADMVTVLESWHLRSSDDADDGRHTISIQNCTLMDEEYTKDYFPFAVFRWTRPMLGYYGVGLAEELVGIQLEINKILRNIQLAQHLVAVPQVWVHQGSKVVTGHINNQIGGVKTYVGQPPIFHTPTAMTAEIYQHLESLYRKAYEITGVSQMSAKSEKPRGVSAAVAIEALNDLETERFMTVAQAHEEFYMDICDISIDLTSDIFKGDEHYPPVKDLAIATEDQNFMESIKWKDVWINKDRYVMRVFPTGFLPSQPAAKFQRVQDYLQAGFFSREEAMSLLDFPDLKAVQRRITGPRDAVLKIISDIVDKEKYRMPEPFMDLELGKRLAQAEYNYAISNDAPETVLEFLQRFMQDCNNMLEKAQMEAQRRQMEAQLQAQQPAVIDQQAMQAMAVPEQAPTSELLPVAGAQ